MTRFAILSMCVLGLLAGCGEVVVFGHVMREHPASETKPESSAPAATPTPAKSQVPADAGTRASGNATAPADASAASTAASAPAASTSPRSAVAATSVTSAHVAHVVKAVNIVVTPEARAKVTGDTSRFTADALLDAIRTELKSRKLLDEQDPHASGTAEIVVDGLATRPTVNAVLFGYKMLAGTLEGDIRVTGASDTDSTGSRIVAESGLRISASGEDKNPLGPLYRRFAVLAADRLAGVASQASDSAESAHF